MDSWLPADFPFELPADFPFEDPNKYTNLFRELPAGMPLPQGILNTNNLFNAINQGTDAAEVVCNYPHLRKRLT
jgi:hypothetical protein